MKITYKTAWPALAGLMLLLIFMVATPTAIAQTGPCDYLLNLKLSSSYNEGCLTGDCQCNPDHWKVDEGCCWLEPNLTDIDWNVCGVTAATTIPVRVLVNKAGIMEPGDYMDIQYRCDAASGWQSLRYVDYAELNAHPSVTLYEAVLQGTACGSFDSLRVRIILETQHHHQHLMIKDGQLSVNDYNTFPVTLLDVSAKAVFSGNAANIQWRTGSEIGFSHFVLRRMKEGATDWTEIASIPGTGAAIGKIASYQYVDYPAETGTYHYQLIMVDLDGSQETSNFVSVEIRALESAGFLLYPNPAQLELVVQLRDGLLPNPEDQLSLVDMYGSTLMEFVGTALSDSRISLDVSHLSPGLYFVVLDHGNDHVVQSIMVAH
jgi:hypothetical protein